jgi:hypothetical protein
MESTKLRLAMWIGAVVTVVNGVLVILNFQYGSLTFSVFATIAVVLSAFGTGIAFAESQRQSMSDAKFIHLIHRAANRRNTGVKITATQQSNCEECGSPLWTMGNRFVMRNQLLCLSCAESPEKSTQ